MKISFHSHMYIVNLIVYICECENKHIVILTYTTYPPKKGIIVFVYIFRLLFPGRLHKKT